MKPGYKLTEVGVIPEEWEVVPLGQLASFRTGPFGSALHKSDYTEDGVPVINPMHIVDGLLVPSPTMTITEAAAMALHDFRLMCGDIVIGRRGEMGRCAVVNEEQSGWLCGTGSMIIRPKNADPSFLQRVLSSPAAIAAIEESSVGTTMVNLNQVTLAKLRLQLPSVREQHAISAALHEVDALLVSLEHLIAKKRHLKQAAMQQLLTGQTRLPGFHGEWEVKRLGEIGYFQGGTGFPVTRQGRVSGDYPFFKVSDMNNEGNATFMLSANHWIDETTRRELGAPVVPEKAIVFAKVGAAVFLERKRIVTRPSCIDNNLAAFVVDAAEADVRFVHYSLCRIEFSSHVSTTALPSLSGRVLAGITISLPPIDEQRAVAQVLVDMDSEIAALEARRDKTRALKEAMMQELLTGRTRLV